MERDAALEVATREEPSASEAVPKVACKPELDEACREAEVMLMDRTD